MNEQRTLHVLNANLLTVNVVLAVPYLNRSSFNLQKLLVLEVEALDEREIGNLLI